MPIPLNAREVLDREFLEVRARLLQIAASLDRLDRAAAQHAGSVSGDPRREKIDQALELLKGFPKQRAEQIQLLFSHSYDEQWRKKMGC